MVNKLIKSYFNLKPLFRNKKSSRVQVRFKRLSLNRILVSRAEMKHTNNKVIITVYLYNKNKKFFFYKLKNLYKTFLFTRKKTPSLKVVNKYDKPKKTIISRRKKGVFLFSSKRFKKSKKNFKHEKAIKPNLYLKLIEFTKRDLSKFLFNIAPNDTKRFALKAKYKSLIKKYYSLLSNNKLNTISNKNYFLNYVNLGKTNSSLKSYKNIYSTNLYESTLKKKYFIQH